MSVVHPIARAWISTGGTGARNYDEFADDAEITQIIASNPSSALAIEMPHQAPESLDKSFAEALVDADLRLASAKAAGRYVPAERVVVLYRIGGASYGLFAMVDTDQISTSADEPGIVIRNEDVFLEKVRERVALAQATRHLLSPVLLLQTAAGDELHAALVKAVEAAGPAVVTDIDHVGRVHEIWPLSGEEAGALLDLAGAGELVVADGNHRSLAAQIGALPRFLAVITTPASVAIDPYHRLVTDSPLPFDALLERLVAAGATAGGRSGVRLLSRDGEVLVQLPHDPGTNLVDRMDHALVERLLFRDALGMEPGDKRITYVGGDYEPSWLAGEVRDRRADLAVLIPPVRVEDFVAVNLARQKMPRKSTWFTPKARAGLVVADLAAE
jgi:uncharacterized protein (DUF1015 family)